MAGFSVASNEHLIRSNLWSRDIRELLLDDLIAMRFVKHIRDFPDGTTINFPTMGEAATFDYVEGQSIRYENMDTGNLTFEFDQYVGSAHAISNKFMRDSYYAQEVLSSFVPRQHRALMERVETRIFNRMNAGQTATDLNAINGASHRWVGSGLNESMALKDFAMAQYALQKANVPLSGLVACVDPSVAYTIQTQTNMVNLISPQQQWQDVTRKGIMTGMKFVFNIYGWDVYVSNYLPRDLSETISGSPNGTVVTVGVANMFFSTASEDLLPIIGGFRQMPTVESEYNKDLQQHEYLTISEYGFKVWRPENTVIVLTDTNVIV